MKKLLMMAVAGLATAGFAGMGDALLSFSTQGPDKYADGTTVLDGERYALVWTADGAEFGGFKADGTLVSENDRVVILASLAKDGHCPPTLFQVSEATVDALQGGTYGVYLLDTRVKAADGTTTLATVQGKKPAVVNAQVAVSDEAAAGKAGQAQVAVAAAAVGGASVAVESIVDKPQITGIAVNAATIKVSVAGMMPGVTYKVVTCAKPGDQGEELDATAKDGEFEFAKPEGTFFKVIGTRAFGTK